MYLAEDTKLDRKVALKFLPAHLTLDHEARRRFEREAKAAAALNHPNIVTIYEIAEHDNQTFIAMEYVDGQSLRDKMAGNSMPIEDVIDIATQICEGLDKAHRAGIVHRDIKPENILIDSDGRVKILDFGLAKLKGAGKLTKEQSTVGTVYYMSPEQLKGEEVDHRSDIWSVGVVLHEMLTGKRPFKGEYDQAVAYSILNESPLPIMTTEFQASGAMISIIEKCIIKKPTDRFQSTSDIVAELKQTRQTFPISSSSTKSSSFLRTTSNKRSWAWIGGGVVILVISFVMWLGVFSNIELSPGGKRIDVLPFENLGSPEVEDFADGINIELINRLNIVQDLGVIARQSVIGYKNSDKSIQEIGNELGVDFVLDGTIRWQKSSAGTSLVCVVPALIKVSDETQYWSRPFEAELAADIFKIQSDIAEQVASALDIRLNRRERQVLESIPTENLEAYKAYLRGVEAWWSIDFTENARRQAIDHFRHAIELDPMYAQAYAGLSQLYVEMYFLGLDRTKERLTMAKETLDRAYELQPDLTEAKIAEGWYHYMGYRDYQKALEAFSFARKVLPKDRQTLFGIGVIYKRQGKFKKAIQYFKEAYELNPRDPSMPNELHFCYVSLRRYEEAAYYSDLTISLAPVQSLGYFDKVQDYWLWKGDVTESRTYVENMPEKNISLWAYAWYCQEMFERNYESASSKLRILPIDVIDDQGWYFPKSQLQGQLYNLMGNYKLASTYYDSARVFLEAELKNRPNDFRLYSSLGLVYAGLKIKEEATRNGQKSVELCPIEKYAHWGSLCLENLALTYSSLGMNDEAIEQIENLLSRPTLFSVRMLEQDPRWDPLREHPKYKRLIEKYGK